MSEEPPQAVIDALNKHFEAIGVRTKVPSVLAYEVWNIVAPARRPSPPVVDGELWQTIETAPKDGTPILLFYRDFCGGGTLVTVGSWHSFEGREFEATWEHPQGYGDADMWQPLPAPPQSPRSEGDK